MKSLPYFYAENKNYQLSIINYQLSIIKTLITTYENYAKWTSVRRKIRLVDTD